MSKLTKAGEYRANQPVYAVDQESGVGILVAAGDLVPANTLVSETSMDKVKPANRELLAATQEALDPFDKDVDLTQLSLAALQARAAERGIDAGKLKKDDLVAVIKAAHDPAR